MADWLASIAQTDDAAAKWLAVVSIALIAAVMDWRWRWIPNSLTVPAAAAGLAMALLVGGGAGFLSALGGLLLCLMPFALLFALAGAGAGDAKLMAAVGAWLGVSAGALALACVLLAGAAMAGGIVFLRGTHREAWANLQWIGFTARSSVRERSLPGQAALPAPENLQPMPYGVAIFVGCAAAAGLVALI